tara:strand:- start:77 stop:1042 length:966 start_codon:yes stop_codon:yes gene_type:complete
MVFHTYNGGGTIPEVMRIDNTGKVGIATTSPGVQLSNTSTRLNNSDGLGTHLSGFNWEVNGQGQTAVFSNLSTGSGAHNAGVAIKLASTDSTDKILDLESGGVNRVRVLGNGNVGIGTSAPTGILHVSGASPHVKMVNTTWGANSSATSKKTIDNTGGGTSYRGMMTELLFTWSQTTADSWVMVRTPQAYSDWKAGGWADFKLTWSGYHASGTAMMMWTAVFGNHHGRPFQWTKTGITTLKNNDSYYGYTPAVAFYRQTTNAHGYNTDDERMRNLFIKVSGNAGSNVCSQRSLYINGLSGGMEYEVIHMGTSTPAGGLTSV